MYSTPLDFEYDFKQLQFKLCTMALYTECFFTSLTDKRRPEALRFCQTF
jgi:hypothetical protein